MSLTACWSSRVLRQICLSGIGFVTAARADIPVDTGTNLSIGPAVYVTPSYPGASSTRGFALPYIDAEFNNLLYSNAADLLGIYAYKSPTANLGAAIQYDFTERLDKDDYRLRFLKDIKATPRGKLFPVRPSGSSRGMSTWRPIWRIVVRAPWLKRISGSRFPLSRIGFSAWDLA